MTNAHAAATDTAEPCEYCHGTGYYEANVDGADVPVYCMNCAAGAAEIRANR